MNKIKSIIKYMNVLCNSRVIGEVSGSLELGFQQVSDVGVESVDEREALLLPLEVLCAEGGHVVGLVGRRLLLADEEVFVGVVGVLHEAKDVRVETLARGGRHCKHNFFLLH